MNSVFGRLSYDYNGKYLLEGSLRYDESSVFPKSQRVAVSTGWVVSKEGFGIMIQNQLLKAKRKLGTKW
jgi:outer membrane cobalamin receptor